MKEGGTGGGNTITGLIYEGKVDLTTFINQQKDYSVIGNDVFYKGKCVAYLASDANITSIIYPYTN